MNCRAQQPAMAFTHTEREALRGGEVCSQHFSWENDTTPVRQGKRTCALQSRLLLNWKQLPPVPEPSRNGSLCPFVMAMHALGTLNRKDTAEGTTHYAIVTNTVGLSDGAIAHHLSGVISQAPKLKGACSVHS